MESISAKGLFSSKDHLLLVVDIRDGQYFRHGHIKGSINIDVYNNLHEGNFDIVREKLKTLPKNKTIMFAVALASLSIVLYFSGLFIVLREIKKIETAFYSTESDFYKEEKIRVIKSITEINKESVKELQDFFIKKGDEVKFIEQIENVARSFAVDFEIMSINVKENKTASFKEDVILKMKIEGSWKEVMYFLNKLERMSFGVSIENLNLEANTPGNWSGIVEFIIFNQGLCSGSFSDLVRLLFESTRKRAINKDGQ